MDVRPLDLGTDGLALVALLREMQAHYRVPCPLDDVVLRDLAGLPAGVVVLVAVEPDGTVVGVATLGPVYPGPGLRAGLFLKDLFVAARRRGAGVGTALLREAASLALARGLGRIDWTADRGDAPLLALYRHLGAAEQPEKVFFRLTGPALAALAAGGSPPAPDRTAPDG